MKKHTYTFVLQTIFTRPYNRTKDSPCKRIWRRDTHTRTHTHTRERADHVHNQGHMCIYLCAYTTSYLNFQIVMGHEQNMEHDAMHTPRSACGLPALVCATLLSPLPTLFFPHAFPSSLHPARALPPPGASSRPPYPPET